MTFVRHNRADSVPLHRAAILRPFTHFLADVGAPIETGFRRARLPCSVTENVNNYITSRSFYAFVLDMARSQGIMHLGFRVAEAFGANSADPHLRRVLHQAPTLFRGLRDLSELSMTTVTHCRMGLVEPEHRGHMHFAFVPSCDRDNPAFDQVAWFGLRAMIDAVRVFAGAQWLPNEIGIMNARQPSHHIREQLRNTNTKLNQRYCYLVLDDALASAPPLRNTDPVPSAAPPHYETAELDFVGSLQQCLGSYVADAGLNIDTAADLTAMSTRTLQRKLAQSGTQFREVLDRVRFQRASEMLKNPDMQITDVARVIGYQNSTHFSRAFRRFTGVTPSAYREYVLSAPAERNRARR